MTEVEWATILGKMICRCCGRRIKNPQGDTRIYRACYRCRTKYPNLLKTMKVVYQD